MDEPRNIDSSENPARTFMVSNEVQNVAEITVEYRGGGWWAVHTDNDGPRTKPEMFRGWIGSSALRRAQQFAAMIMEEQADTARATCECGTDGQDTSGNGNFACGVMSPHGISVTVSDLHGNDITQDYYINGV